MHMLRKRLYHLLAYYIGIIPVLRGQAPKHGVLRSVKAIHLATHGLASTGFLAFTSSFPVAI